MREIQDALEALEGRLAETLMRGAQPERAALVAALDPLSRGGGLWPRWRDAALGMIDALILDSKISTVFFDTIAEARHATSAEDAASKRILRVGAERMELFRPDEMSPVDASIAPAEPVEFDEEIRQAFIAEADELLQEIEECVLNLASDVGSVKKLFRVMHTLKGSSGMLGLGAMNRIAHAAESILERVRQGEVRPSVSLEEALLAAKDRLLRIVRLFESGEPTEIETESVIAALRDAESGKAPAAVVVADESAAIPSTRKESTIRIAQEKLDDVFERMGEVLIGRIRLETHLLRMGTAIGRKDGVEESYDALRAAVEDYSRAHSALQERVMTLRLAPVGGVFERFPRVVRETARRLGKEIAFHVTGADVEVDKGICEAIVDPLVHLIRNSIDHGIESTDVRVAAGKTPNGNLTLAASYRGDRVVIEIVDDGKGMNAEKIGAKAVEKGVITTADLSRMDEREKLMLIFRPGFSTAENVSDLSGRGVGMDVVRDAIERLKGSVEVASTPREGSRVSLFLPLTLALVDLLLVRIGSDTVAFPLYVVRETLRIERRDLEAAGDRPVILLRGSYLPLVSLSAILGIESGAHDPLNVVIVEVMGESVGFEVDEFLGRSEAVMKPLGAILAAAPFLSGATILGDGQIVPILDPAPILRAPGSRNLQARRKKILVVEDSEVFSKHLTSLLRGAGFTVTVAVDGIEGLDAASIGEFDIVSCDIEMPRMDGYEFCRRLREDARFARLPVVAVTTHAEMADRVKGLEAGFDEYLTKPIDEAVYLATLENLLKRDAK